jgi:hypothetical protein
MTPDLIAERQRDRTDVDGRPRKSRDLTPEELDVYLTVS